LQVKFRGETVGNFIIDIYVEEKVLIEIRVASSLKKEFYAQTISYLKATGIEVRVLVNFGTSRIEYRRFDNKFIESKSILSTLIE